MQENEKLIDEIAKVPFGYWGKLEESVVYLTIPVFPDTQYYFMRKCILVYPQVDSREFEAKEYRHHYRPIFLSTHTSSTQGVLRTLYTEGALFKFRAFFFVCEECVLLSKHKSYVGDFVIKIYEGVLTFAKKGPMSRLSHFSDFNMVARERIGGSLYNAFSSTRNRQ